MRAPRLFQSLASVRKALKALALPRSGSTASFPLRSPLLIAALLIAEKTFSAAPSENPAAWPRWLESGSSPVGFSLHTLAGLPGASVSADVGYSDATSSLLAWTEQTLRLIQKYQQNPQRAVRSLALVHAAVHDAFVLAARDSAGAPRACECAA